MVHCTFTLTASLLCVITHSFQFKTLVISKNVSYNSVLFNLYVDSLSLSSALKFVFKTVYVYFSTRLTLVGAPTHGPRTRACSTSTRQTYLVTSWFDLKEFYHDELSKTIENIQSITIWHLSTIKVPKTCFLISQFPWKTNGYSLSNLTKQVAKIPKYDRDKSVSTTKQNETERSSMMTGS